MDSERLSPLDVGTRKYLSIRSELSCTEVSSVERDYQLQSGADASSVRGRHHEKDNTPKMKTKSVNSENNLATNEVTAG